MHERHVISERHTHNRGRAVPLELFFDLVFVFAITQVTSLLASDVTWSGLGRGIAVLALLWWAWVGYSWLGSAIDPEEGWLRVAFFAAMAAMFVVALATADAFGASAPTFAVAYFCVRALHVAVFVIVSSGDRAFRRAIWSMAPSFVIGPALLIVGSFVSGPTRGALWAVAIIIDYGGALLGGSQGWRLSPSHFAERHGLIVIIALGEAIVSVGFGVADGRGVSAELVIVALLVVAVAAAFWWMYFDIVAIVAERKLHELEGVDRNRMARDSFSYLHLPMVVGIVLVALASKKIAVLPGKELSDVTSAALGGGAAMYVLTLSLLRRRNMGRFNVQRLIAASVLTADIVLIRALPGAAALASVVAICWALVAYESISNAELRRQIRSEHH
jgi:low temperature requirement protein LtrA